MRLIYVQAVTYITFSILSSNDVFQIWLALFKCATSALYTKYLIELTFAVSAPS